MVYLAVFAVLLGRYSGGQEDILVSTPSANRDRSEIEGLIGLFVNPLLLRLDLSGDPTFRELLGRVRRVVLGAFEHAAARSRKCSRNSSRAGSRRTSFTRTAFVQPARLPELDSTRR